MAKRTPTERVVLSLRIKEELRAELETCARDNDNSMNAEIAQRLEASLRDDKLGAVVFGDRVIFEFMEEFARLIRAIESVEGKKFNEDYDVCRVVVETIHTILTKMPQAIAAGEWSSDPKSAADRYAYTYMLTMLRHTADRYAENARDAAFESMFEEVWEKLREDGVASGIEAIPEAGETVEEARKRVTRAVYHPLYQMMTNKLSAPKPG